MSSADSRKVDQSFLANAMASFLQIAGVALLLFICFRIVQPFLAVVVWGVIISVALHPFFLSLSGRLGGRPKSAATVIALIGISIIVIPAWLLADSTVGALKYVGESMQTGSVTVPPPSESVAEWPLIGEKVFEAWSHASADLEETINQFESQLTSLGKRAISFAGHTVLTVFQFVFSIIIAAALFTVAEDGYRAAKNIANSLAGTERGAALTDMSVGTIRSVFKGVLGVAVIQAVASAIGMVIAGIPAAGLIAGGVLVLAIIQLPPLLIMGPVAVWYFSVADGVAATVFLIYALIVSASDTFLKPLFLGRGLDTPMLVILIGAIGGAIAMGIVGLFIGAVVLALGYELLTVWMAPEALDDSSSQTAD